MPTFKGIKVTPLINDLKIPEHDFQWHQDGCEVFIEVEAEQVLSLNVNLAATGAESHTLAVIADGRQIYYSSTEQKHFSIHKAQWIVNSDGLVLHRQMKFADIQTSMLLLLPSLLVLRLQSSV